jgi:hypothetical protein
MGTNRSPPSRVLEVPVKWTRSARSPADLQVGPETLSTTTATLEDLGRFSLDHGGAAASSPEDREILSVITEGDLPKSVTDPDEGPPTSNGNPNPLAI